MFTTRTPHLTRDALIAAFHDWNCPRERWRVGIELERHLLRPDTGLPVPYFGEHGVRWLMERMAPNGWETKFEGENPIAMFRDQASITLEPGSQYELSTAPFEDVTGCARQALTFVEEVQAAIGDAPLTMAAVGFTPFANVDDVPWVPKGRYAVMKEYLIRFGPLAHHMMKGTCAVQASFDFCDEADAARKVRLGMLWGPLTTAMSANSPLTEGKRNGYASFRGHIWTQTDSRRTGFPDAGRDFTFERWVDYLLDVPMMFLRDDTGWRDAAGRTFRDWMTHGIEGGYPDDAAWDLHMTSVFPEVRVKRLIEIRGADCVQHDLAMAFAAMFTGLLYDDRAQSAALALGEEFASIGTSTERFEEACRHGLAGTIGARRLSAWAESLVDLARAGLERRGKDEAHFLAPLAAQVATGESPSAGLLRAYERDPRPQAIVEYLRYRA